MNRFFLLPIVVAVFHSFNVRGQSFSIQHGPIIANPDKKEIRSYIGSNDSAFFIQRVSAERNTLLIIERYNKFTLKKEFEVPVDLLTKDYVLRAEQKPGAVLLYKDRIHVVYNAFEKGFKLYRLLVKTISTRGVADPEVKELMNKDLESYDNFIMSDYIFCLTPDSSKFMCIHELHRYKKPMEITGYFYDLASLKLISERKLPSSYKESVLITENHKVDNEGNLAYTFAYIVDKKTFVHFSAPSWSGGMYGMAGMATGIGGGIGGTSTYYEYGYGACFVSKDGDGQQALIKDLNFEFTKLIQGVDVFFKGGKLIIAGVFVDSKKKENKKKEPGYFISRVDVESGAVEIDRLEYFAEDLQNNFSSNTFKFPDNTPEYKFRVFVNDVSDGYVLSFMRAFNPYLVRDIRDLHTYRNMFQGAAASLSVTALDMKKALASSKWSVENSLIARVGQDGTTKWVKPLYINLASNFGYVNILSSGDKVSYFFNDHKFNIKKLDYAVNKKYETFYTAEREYGDVNFVCVSYDKDGKAQRNVIQLNEEAGFVPFDTHVMSAKNKLITFFKKYERENFATVTLD